MNYRNSFRQISQIVGWVKHAMTNSWLPALANCGQILSLQYINSHTYIIWIFFKLCLNVCSTTDNTGWLETTASVM